MQAASVAVIVFDMWERRKCKHVIQVRSRLSESEAQVKKGRGDRELYFG